MKANRRGFLGLFGGAVAAGPSAAKEALFSTRDLDVNGVGLFSGEAMASPGSPMDHKKWARDGLKKLLSRTPEEIAKTKRDTNVYNLPPDVYVLRSVSPGTKIRMAREVIFLKNEREREGYLHGIIKGWWS